MTTTRKQDPIRKVTTKTGETRYRFIVDKRFPSRHIPKRSPSELTEHGSDEVRLFGESWRGDSNS